MNKDLILKTIDIVNKMKQSDIVEIIKEGQSRKYQLIYNEFYKIFEFICLAEKDTIWNSYESFNNLQEDLVNCAVKGYFEDIGICK